MTQSSPGAPGAATGPEASRNPPGSGDTARPRQSGDIPAMLFWSPVALASAVLTYLVARSEAWVALFNPEARGQSLPLFAALLVGFCVAFLGPFAMRRQGSRANVFWTRMERSWMATLEGIALVAPSFVRWILFALLGFILWVTYGSLPADPDLQGAVLGSGERKRLGIMVLCVMPTLLTACSTLLVERRVARSDYMLAPHPAHDPSLLKEVQSTWIYESTLTKESIQRMARHAAILGFLASAILCACVVLVAGYAPHSARHLGALTVGTAATVSFLMHLGKILFRSASNDATARMMAYAARTLLFVTVCAIFLSIVLLGTSAGKPEGQAADQAVVVGVAVALLGERALQLVTDRAAAILGMAPISPGALADLRLIEGLNEEDIARLSEERVDSVHALAYMPTPRLFFNTIYSLQRICDWQDQALLIVLLGRTNAQLLRERFLIRGVISALALARRLGDAPPKAVARAGEGDAAQPKGAPITEAQREEAQREEAQRDEVRKQRNDLLAQLTQTMGIPDGAAYLGLKALLDDPLVHRLAAFSRAVTGWKELPDEGDVPPEAAAPTASGEAVRQAPQDAEVATKTSALPVETSSPGPNPIVDMK
ncbi:hypothetical protein [Chondromyces apiculatus]|uniref:Uncharacterized protein n=1 Tax=Chondromyces apiculatus DSM 436 TaxID=1192034 RepID=A0A017SV70_9BACT|nr:hypothetical protein [Chondromyces apiculatus]EYF00647.1 Hypothetical protein CAP_0400 [Chondromyces apiculatus DSM 436]